MTKIKDRLRKLDGTDLLLLAVSIVLLVLSGIFYKERIIFTDTAVYAQLMINSGNFYIATNRYISVLSQVLPLMGLLCGFSLKAILCLFSVNYMLLPVLTSFICRFALRQKAAALGVLLFYTLMATWTFYYPVSEFQMGLCLLFLFHAFLCWYFQQGIRKRWLFYVLSFVLVSTIVFSHPLSILVFAVWAAWFYYAVPEGRKPVLFFPALVAILAYGVKEHFFKTFVGEVVYDDQQKKGLSNFGATIYEYFNAPLANDFYKVFRDEYFLVIAMVLFLLYVFVRCKKWLLLFFFPLSLLTFWLLVTVSFRNGIYDYYTEHLYQPLPFIVALLFAHYLPVLVKSSAVRTAILLLIFVVSLSKVVDNHAFFRNRLQWFDHVISFMRDRNIHNAAITPRYLPYWSESAYWAASSESYLLSSLPGPDSSVNLKVAWDVGPINKYYEQAEGRRTRYFNITFDTFILLDSLAPDATLDSMRQVYR